MPCSSRIPDGYVLVSISTLTALLAIRDSRAPQPAPYSATFEGLTVATAMLTSQLGGHQVNRADLAIGTPDEAVIGALVAVGAGLLKAHQEDSAPAFLQYLGLIAASRGHRPDGEVL